MSSPKRMRKFPIGTSSFAELVSRKDSAYVNYFVDKTLFIQQLIESSGKVLLFPRFRRCGKSMNLDMLKCFFDIREREVNRKLFEGLKIERAIVNGNESCMNYQGQYPVIFLDFKKLSQNNYQEMFEMFKTLIRRLYEEHDYLLKSPNLTEAQKGRINAIINEKANDASYKDGLRELIEFVYRHYNNKKLIVLIDEYDVPFQRAIHQGLYGKEDTDKEYLKEIKSLFSVFLGDALKGNDKYLEKCVMTGIVRIAGAGIFSQLNNLKVHTILDKPFSGCFGFTKMEVEHLVKEVLINYPKVEEFMVALEKWYNGYRFGDEIIYNPWSVIRACDDLLQQNIKDINHLNCYWLDTSNNELIRDKLLNCRTTEEEREVNELIATLISGKEAEKTLNSNLIFDSRIESIEHLWVLLLSTGYLNIVANERTADDQLKCKLAIPNREVRVIYTQVFRDWAKKKGISSDSPLIKYLLEGNAEDFCKELDGIFKKIVSVRDTIEKQPGKKGSKEEKKTKDDETFEAYYHGFMVGILALSLNANYHKVMLTSNRESGYGFYDLLLEPKSVNDQTYNKAVIFEFKHCHEEKDLEKEAKLALKQIKEKEYETNLKERGVKTIVLIGVAFHKKKLKYKHEEMSTNKLIYKKAQVSDAVVPLLSSVPSSIATVPALPKMPSKLAQSGAPLKISHPSTDLLLHDEPVKKKLALSPSSLPAVVQLTPLLSLSKPAAEKKHKVTDFFKPEDKTEGKKQKVTPHKSVTGKEEIDASKANVSDDEILVSSDEDSKKTNPRPVKK